MKIPAILIILMLPFYTMGMTDYISLKDTYEVLTNNSNHRATLINATKLQNLAQAEHNSYYEAYACYYMGISNVLLGNSPVGVALLNDAQKIAENIANDTLLICIYNGLGINAANHNNHQEAQQFFFKGLECAMNVNDYVRQAKIELNLAEISFLRKDTTGLKYALSAYHSGLKLNNKPVVLNGSYQCANLLLLKGEYEDALNYIKIAKDLAEEINFSEKSGIYKLYADIFFQLKRYNDAIDALKKALADSTTAQAATLPEIYLTYAQVLSAQKKYKESNAIIKRGVEIANAKSSRSTVPDFYKLMTENYEALGLAEKALQISKEYQAECSRIYDIEKERIICELKTIYEVSQKERDAEYHQLLFEQESKKSMFLWLLIVCLITLIGVLIFFYRKRGLLYKAIVRQNKEAILKEAELRTKIDSWQSQTDSDTILKQNARSLSDERIDDLFTQICLLMENEKIYCDNNLTRDRLADMLNTNRTYLSQVINNKTGLSYTQFINQYRIKEAVKILSDTNSNYPLKALCADLGFNSMTTFYKLFQEKTGMTPSAYRHTNISI